ncbi:MAG TPA: RNA polymerase sigma factor, partial [Gemmataceae bacterium]|nr:RNA polymerase sigma factor [Gemmataceae bacterium]
MAHPLSSLPDLLRRLLAPPLSRFSDRELLRGFAELGNEAAFAEILDRHGPMLMGMCRRLLHDEHLAEDVLQATFLVLARKARSVRRRESLASWLYGVAQRLARKARLAETARSKREQRAAKAEAQLTAGNAGWDDLLRVLDEELQRLPERFRLPLLLCYLEGRTQDEAAKQLGWGLSTLRRRLEKGRELLKTRMTRRGATLGAGLFAGFLAPSAACIALAGSFRESVLASCTATGKNAAISATVLALVRGEIYMSIITKIALSSTLALFVGGAWALGSWATSDKPSQPVVPQPVKPAVAAVAIQEAKQPAAGHDLFGDPLPKGASTRLGTVAFRHGPITGAFIPVAKEFELGVVTLGGWRHADLAFSADGKHLASAGGGWARGWDVATGQTTVSFGGGAYKKSRNSVIFTTADAKLAREASFSSDQTKDYQCVEIDLATGKKRTYILESVKLQRGFGPGLPTHMSPDGKFFVQRMVAAPGVATPLVFWEADSGKFLREIHGQYAALAFVPDCKTMIA